MCDLIALVAKTCNSIPFLEGRMEGRDYMLKISNLTRPWFEEVLLQAPSATTADVDGHLPMLH